MCRKAAEKSDEVGCTRCGSRIRPVSPTFPERLPSRIRSGDIPTRGLTFSLTISAFLLAACPRYEDELPKLKAKSS